MENIKQKIRRSVLYLLGFSAFPMLTSCYGMPQDYENLPPPPDVEGKIVTNDQKPVEGILVSATTESGISRKTYSNSEGEYTLYKDEDIRKIIFSDIDGNLNGGDFEQQTKTMEELKADGKVIMKLKKTVPNE